VTVAYLVLYEGKPRDKAAFDRYYREQHVPILRRFPNIRAIRIHTGTRESVLYMLVEMRFDSLEHLDLALASEARAEARRDRDKFPAFDGTIRHQTVVTEDVTT